MADCNICRRELNNPRDPLSLDCGGDCLLCMAAVGDPDCLSSLPSLVARMEVVIAVANALIRDMQQHEGAEGFSDSTRKLEEQYDAALSNLAQD